MAMASISLILRGDELDILFRDATGNLVNAQADGGKIYPLHTSDVSVSVRVIFPLNAVAVITSILLPKITRSAV